MFGGIQLNLTFTVSEKVQFVNNYFISTDFDKKKVMNLPYKIKVKSFAETL